MNNKYLENIENVLMLDFGKNCENADIKELYIAIGKAFCAFCINNYKEKKDEKKAYYLSAEFLTGNLLKSNLFNTGLLEETENFLQSIGRSLDDFEKFDDPALGNGGLGRLAACFLDSAASCDIPLYGFGIRYKYGYFKQIIKNNQQVEEADLWQSYGDSFGQEHREKKVLVRFGDEEVYAVPYIYYVPGFHNKRLNKLILFECESTKKLSYHYFDNGDYQKAYESIINADIISASLYPNDNDKKGKALRLKQQYFFISASLQYLFNELVEDGKKFSDIDKFISIQLNDTHPVIAIPEFIRLMIDSGFDFEYAVLKAKQIFSYTNHTVLAEALEKWDISLFNEILPQLYPIMISLEKRLESEISDKIEDSDKIFDGKYIYMANLACYISKSINGVAEIHTGIIKKDTLKFWYSLYPGRFNNKTNGVTQRRWQFLANPELYALLKEYTAEKIDSDFGAIKEIEKYASDKEFCDKFYEIRRRNKEKLIHYINNKEGIELSPDFILDVQIKRLHEYKRQLMNILSVIAIYNRLKQGKLENFPKTLFLFGAKAAPGYYMAKRIIEFINSAAKVINNDNETNKTIRIIFVENYDVSYAEKIIPAADISEQISLAGKEASGTSNMKFMMNGAVTLGTLDGANIEIVEKSGAENNYIFGLKESEVQTLLKSYNPLKEYKNNSEIKIAVDTLINGFTGKRNEFKDIYDSLLNEDSYFVLRDLPDYLETKIKAIKDTCDKYAFMKKCILNTANSAGFSSDRTVKEYAEDIWFKEK